MIDESTVSVVKVINRHYHEIHSAKVVRLDVGRALLDLGWTELWFDLFDGDTEKDDSLYLDIDDRERLSGGVLRSL